MGGGQRDQHGAGYGGVSTRPRVSLRTISCFTRIQYGLCSGKSGKLQREERWT
jgi:hypothetical protein